MLEHRSKFFTLFPPPDLLSMRCAGLHINDDAIRALISSKKRSGYKILAHFERPLPKGLVEAGYVTNENALAQEIKIVREKLGLSNVRVSLPEEKMYLFQIDIPGVIEENMRSVVEVKLEENVPFPPAEAIFECDPIEKKGGLITRVGVVAFHQKTVQSYLSACTIAGLDVLAFDTEPHALVRSIAPDKKQVALILQISNQKTNIYIVSERTPRFSSTIQTGGNNALLKSEAEKVMTYWNTHNDRQIEYIYVFGNNAESVSISKDLEKISGIKKVISADILSGVSLDYGVALGLSLTD